MSDSLGEQRSETNQERDTDVTDSAKDNLKAILEKLIQEESKNRDRSQIAITPTKPKNIKNPLKNLNRSPSIWYCTPTSPVETDETEGTLENVPTVRIPRQPSLPSSLSVPDHDDLRSPILPSVPQSRTNDANPNSLPSPVPSRRSNNFRNVNPNFRLQIPSTSDSVDGPPPVVTPPLVSPPKSNRSKPVPAVRIPRQQSLPSPLSVPDHHDLRSLNLPSVPQSRTNDANPNSLSSPVPSRRINNFRNVNQNIPLASDCVDGPPSVVTPPLVSLPKSNRSKPVPTVRIPRQLSLPSPLSVPDHDNLRSPILPSVSQSRTNDAKPSSLPSPVPSRRINNFRNVNQNFRLQIPSASDFVDGTPPVVTTPLVSPPKSNRSKPVPTVRIPRQQSLPSPLSVPNHDALRSPNLPSVPQSRTNDANPNSLPSPVPSRRINNFRNVNQNIPSTSDSVDGPPSVVTPPLVSPPKSNRSKPLQRKLSSQSFRKRFPFLFRDKNREEASCDAQENKSTPEIVKKERFNEADVEAYMLLEPAVAALKIEIPADKVRRAIKEKLEQTGCGFASDGDLIDYVFKQEREEGPHQASAPRQVNEIDIQLCLRSELALAALSIPLSLRRVKQAIKDKLERTGCNFASLEALTEAAYNLPEEEDPLAPSQAPSEENRPLNEEKLCIICMGAEICVVFVPCGHLRTCPKCSANLKICPLCRCPIESTIRTFLP